MSNLILGLSLTVVLLIIAFVLSRKYFALAEQYGNDPTNNLKKKKNRIWHSANCLWIISTVPLMIGLFSSDYSPLKILKNYLPVASIIILIVAFFTVFAKNIKTLFPTFKQPDRQYVEWEYAYSVLRGMLWLIVVLTMFFLLSDSNYRKAAFEYYFKN